MNDVRTIHAVSHTHWDREWYFSTLDTQLFALKAFSELIEALENNPRFVFHLDGQSSIFDDFIRLKPKMAERAGRLVQQKRLLIGPWYTQTDTFNVHGESIIRNLKYGILSARKLGHAMMVGYLPDTFGHNSQLPTLLRGCNLDNIVFWRGIDHDTQVAQSQFIWRAPSGSQVIACAMLFALRGSQKYSTGRCPPAGKNLSNGESHPPTRRSA